MFSKETLFCRSGFCCTLSHGLRGWARRRRSRRGSGWGWSRRWLSGRGLQRHRRRRIPWSIVERNIVAPRQLRWWAVRGRGSIWFHPSEVYASSLEVQKKLLFTKSRCFDSSAARQRGRRARLHLEIFIQYHSLGPQHDVQTMLY